MNYTQSVACNLWIARADQGVGELFGEPGLTCPRRALQDEVLFYLDARENVRQRLSGEKASLVGDVLYCVGWRGRLFLSFKAVIVEEAAVACGLGDRTVFFAK